MKNDRVSNWYIHIYDEETPSTPLGTVCSKFQEKSAKKGERGGTDI